jgi:hypothetical protein
VSRTHRKPPQIVPPAATGNAGPQFEGKVGAFYLLSMLSGGEPRGLPGATIRTVELQQRGSGRPVDDVIITATNADGSAAILEIQAKRTLTFTASDEEFADVLAQMWDAAQKPEFKTIRYELAVAIARTTTRVEHDCQEVLHWARHLPDGAGFSVHINREKFASKGTRDFVDVFRRNLATAGASTDDETVWWLLRHFQIFVFDFEVGILSVLGSRRASRVKPMPAMRSTQCSTSLRVLPILAGQASRIIGPTWTEPCRRSPNWLPAHPHPAILQLSFKT